MITYLHKGIGYWELAYELPDSYRVGTTEEDYEGGAYICLSDEQMAFHTEHPEASQLEVLRMELTPEPEDLGRELDEEIAMKVIEIRNYDSSPYVNNFICDGVGAWIDINERTGWMCSLISAKNRGDQNVTFPLMGNSYTVPVEQAFSLLDSINGYADQCTNVTEGHIAAVRSLTSVEEVRAYDHKAGYPEYLRISLTGEEGTL